MLIDVKYDVHVSKLGIFSSDIMVIVLYFASESADLPWYPVLVNVGTHHSVVICSSLLGKQSC